MIIPDTELLEAISKRNPGAMRVFFEIAEGPSDQAIETYAYLLDKKIAGSDLWDLYKCCGYSVDKVHASLVQGTATDQLKAVPGSSFWMETDGGMHKEGTQG